MFKVLNQIDLIGHNLRVIERSGLEEKVRARTKTKGDVDFKLALSKVILSIMKKVGPDDKIIKGIRYGKFPQFSKVCNKCNKELNFTAFYRAGRYFQPCCIKCHSLHTKSKYVPRKRATGFMKLDEKTRTQIRKMLRKKTKREVCKKFKIPYGTFLAWKVTPLPPAKK